MTSGSHQIIVGPHAERQAGNPALNCTGWKTAMTGLSLCCTALLLGLKYGSYPLQGVSSNGDSTIGVEQITTLALMLIHMALCCFFPGQKPGYGKSENKKQVREISVLLVFTEHLPKCVAVFVYVRS